MLKVFYVLLLGLICDMTLGLAQSVDEISGFRDFSFGSDKNVLPGSPKVEFPSQSLPKWSIFTVAGNAFKSATLFDQPIDHVDFSYWDGKLFRVQIFLSPVDCALPVEPSSFHVVSSPEIVAWTKLHAALTGAYGKEDSQDCDVSKGSYQSDWKGKSAGATVHGRRTLNEKENIFQTTFDVYLYSIPLEKLADAEIKVLRKTDASRVADGLK